MYAVVKIPKFNKRRAFNKAVGPGKISKINKRRDYVYSGLESNLFYKLFFVLLLCKNFNLFFKWQPDECKISSLTHFCKEMRHNIL